MRSKSRAVEGSMPYGSSRFLVSRIPPHGKRQSKRRYAWQNQQASASQTYVGVVAGTIIGFHTLALGSAMYDDAPQRLTKGLARHPVPLVLLARLAVDRRWQNQGV